MYIPVALGDVSLVTVAITVTLNGVDSDSPVSTNVTVNIPSDSNAEYLDSSNPTQATRKESKQNILEQQINQCLNALHYQTKK